MKESSKNIWNSWKKASLKSLIWFISILYLELMFVILVSHTISWQIMIDVCLSSIILSKILSIITGFFHEKGNHTLVSIILFLFGVIFSLQGIFYKIFKVYFSIYNLALQDQLNDYLSASIKLILKNGYCIIAFMVPFILSLCFKKKLKEVLDQIQWKQVLILLVSIMVWIGVSIVYINTDKEKTYSTYDLYHNVNNVSLSVKKLGVINTYMLEIKRLVFGFSPKEIEAVVVEEEKEEKPIEYEPNKLELNLNDTGNYNIDLINSYIREEEATLKNEYTGMFKGYNLIYITAESFSEIGVDEILTPTLYRLTHSGFIFKNFYTPNNLSTIGGEFQTLTGLYPDHAILSKWRSGTNYFPYGLATIFRGLGYSTYAYHNNSYVFQDRHQYLASQGFTNFLACYNGLEQRMNCGRWPQSDDEMMEVTVGDYIDNETPFLAYYMTVSGHFGYTYVGNSISSKNRGYVDGMDKSEGAKAYVATQIELDRALSRLLTTLEEHGKLDNTVIVMMADHYPYGLDMDSINSLSTYPRDEIEVNHNALIIWNNKLEDKVIEKPCMSVDVIPTVYNLFGIDYDSRLFSGKDILSTSFGVAVQADRSWVTSKGTYNASKNIFTAKEEVEEDYVERVNRLVNNRLNISKMIVENNYYWYIR